VDHAVGYFRQWIRDAQTPTGRFLPAEETRQRALGQELFRLLSEPAGIVAEDLGVIPDFVRQMLNALSIPGYRVLRWEKDGPVYRNPQQFPALSLVTTGSHDTETLREWWENCPSEERQAVKQAYPELRDLQVDSEFSGAIHRALLAAAENAGSSICILPWQDVLGTRDRINLPGSKADSNWAYRMDFAGEELLSRVETGAAARLLAQLTEVAGR
jgi:4-alpha-glucanotransferase